MINRKQLISDVASDFLMLKRRVIAGRDHPMKPIITPAQAQLMFLIHQQKNITTSEIARLLAITTSAATQLIDSLVNNGFLLREPSNDDRRTFQIKMSASARKHFDQMKRQSLQRMSEVFEVLSDQELYVYHKLSQKVVQYNLKKNGCKKF